MPIRTRTPEPTSRPAAAALAALLALAVAGCASTRPAATQLDDATITAKVKAKLAADPEVNPFKIDVDTREGVVRLSGTVAKAAARDEAEDLARATRGVRGVVNEIAVGRRPVGERLDDAAITAKVKAKLAADPEINPFNIDVDTRDGVVTLSGRVATEAASAEAEKLARDTKGVKGVRNLLAVGKLKRGGR